MPGRYLESNKMILARQSVVYICDLCGVKHKMKWNIRYGDMPPKVQLPDGWFEIGNLHFCDNHHKTIFVDMININQIKDQITTHST